MLPRIQSSSALRVTSDLALHFAELLTRWSVRLAVACYLGRVALDIGLRGDSSSRSISKSKRWLWTIGCLFYLTHVICAFAFFHDWSHHRAYAHTAAQTEAVTGIRWGGGLYFNYVFTLLWLTDTVAWWAGDVHTHYRVRCYFWSIHGVFAFMVCNATVVFGPPAWRWVALIVSVALASVYFLTGDNRNSLR